MKETDVQAQIRQSVKFDGGYCHKLTNQFTVGIPDLLIALPPFAPCIIEVKDLKTVMSGFDRQIDVTPKQRYELRAISEAYNDIDRPFDQLRPTFSGIFVHVIWNKWHYLTGLPYHAERHTGHLLDDPTRTRKRGLRWDPPKRRPYWDVRGLLEACGVTKL